MPTPRARSALPSTADGGELPAADADAAAGDGEDHREQDSCQQEA
jgi:hypothetical protein